MAESDPYHSGVVGSREYFPEFVMLQAIHRERRTLLCW
jgi:hypothetical protein